ncbi:hypothetical protein U1Q18_050602 [Sarracenia purpurea var. burkii]
MKDEVQSVQKFLRSNPNEVQAKAKTEQEIKVKHDKGRENMVLEVPKVEDNEECDEVDSGTTNSNDQSLFPLFHVDDCVQIDKAKFAVVRDDDELKGPIERE